MTEDEAQPFAAEWQLDLLKELADVRWLPQNCGVLGVEVGTDACKLQQLAAKSCVAEAMLRRLPLCQDAQVELNLQRSCLAVAKINHILRANGTELLQQPESLRKYDRAQHDALGRIITGMTGRGQRQASNSVTMGGLGLSNAESAAAAAHLASLTAAAPKVNALCALAAKAGLFSQADAMELFKGQQEEARALLGQQLGEEDSERADRLIADAGRRAISEWEDLVRGHPEQRRGVTLDEEVETSQASADTTRLSLHSAHHRSAPDEQGRIIDSRRVTTPHLQRELLLMVEARAVSQLLDELEQTDDRGARRLAELLDKGTDHGWVWKTDPRYSSRMAEDDWILAARNRLGGEIADAGTTTCRLCGEVLDGAASHAFCCARQKVRGGTTVSLRP